MDCGWGIVYGYTYTVTNSYPLQLGAEIGKPGGKQLHLTIRYYPTAIKFCICDNCSASYINQSFKEPVLGKLSSETYLDNGDTFESIINNAILNFEEYDKRHKDITKTPKGRIRVPGLKGDQQRVHAGKPTKGFVDNCLFLDS